MNHLNTLSLAGAVALITFAVPTSAQPLVQWQKPLGGTGSDYANEVRQTADGGYVAVGNTDSNNGDVSGNHGGSDAWVVKTAANGTVLWQKCLGGTGGDVGYGIRETFDHGFAVVGYTGSNDGNVSGNHGYRDAWVVKLDNTGAILWQKCLGGSGYDEAYSIIQTADSGFVICGYTGSTDGDVSGNHGTYDAWVVKLNKTGALQWQKCLGGTASDFAYSVRATSDGGYAVIANTQSTNGDVTGNHGSSDIWALKLDASSTLLWQTCLGGTAAEQGYSMEQTADGGYILAGYTASNNGNVSGNHGSQDAWVVKLNGSGTLQWQKCLGGTAADQGYSVQPTPDGGYIMAGYAKSNNGDVSGNHGDNDAWLVKLGSTGTVQWQKCFGGTAADGALSVQLTSDGWYILAGSAASNNGDVSGNHGGAADAWLVKLGCANQVVVKITADANPAQLTWELRDSGGSLLASGAPTVANAVNSSTVCLSANPGPGCYTFKLMDSFGDGIAAGGWELRTTVGGLILKDGFSSGSVSPANPPATVAYGSAHSFCLPLGPANIETARCGVFNYALGNKIFANKVTGATQYEFEFTDPDAGFVRRVVRTNNYVQFWDMVTDPLTPGVKYFVRVRSDKDGPLASAHWGTGCEVGLGIAETVLCSGLIPAPLYGHSCSEERTFGTNNSFIYATPVTGATEYQFRIYNTGEGYDTVITRSTYILQLKWVPKPLVDGHIYNVQLNVKVNGLYSGFCASSCTITINNNPVLGGRLAQVEGQPEINLWPNPNDGKQLNVAVHGIDEQVTTADVRLLDLTGRMALGTQLPVANGALNSILDLDGAANGTYLLQITAGDRNWTERVVVNR